jgi:hypothetical protein
LHLCLAIEEPDLRQMQVQPGVRHEILRKRAEAGGPVAARAAATIKTV